MKTPITCRNQNLWLRKSKAQKTPSIHFKMWMNSAISFWKKQQRQMREEYMTNSPFLNFISTPATLSSAT